jgi:hypothetical protein
VIRARVTVNERTYSVYVEAALRLRVAVNGLVVEASRDREGNVVLEVRGRLRLRDLLALASLLPGLSGVAGDVELSLYGARLRLKTSH